MKVRVTATLKKGSFSLRKKSEGEAGIGSEVLSVVFDASQAQLLQRVGNLEAALSLGSFSVYDSTSDGSLHHKIVRVKNEKVVTEPTFEIATVDVTKDPTDDPLFYVKFVQNPLDGHADSTATVRMKALEIVYHKGYVEAVVAFFRPPESQMESVTALLVSSPHCTMRNLAEFPQISPPLRKPSASFGTKVGQLSSMRSTDTRPWTSRSTWSLLLLSSQKSE